MNFVERIYLSVVLLHLVVAVRDHNKLLTRNRFDNSGEFMDLDT